MIIKCQLYYKVNRHYGATLLKYFSPAAFFKQSVAIKVNRGHEDTLQDWSLDLQTVQLFYWLV
jgi:hypothetical protein